MHKASTEDYVDLFVIITYVKTNTSDTSSYMSSSNPSHATPVCVM